MRNAISILWLMLAVSCAHRNPVAPQVELPPNFSGSGNTTLTNAWWTSFHDDELNEWMARALSGNLTLRIAWDRLAQAEAIATRQGAALIPSVDAIGSVARTRRPEEVTGDTVTRDQYSAGLVAAYEIDLWGRVRSARDAARLDVSASAEQVQSAAVTLAASLATVWFELAEQRGQIALLQGQMATSERGLEVLRTRFRSGQGSAVDVLQQEQVVETRRGDIAVAKARATVLENQLAILAGVAPGPDPIGPAANEMPALKEPPATGIPADTLAQRPDVRRAYFQVLAADQRVAAAIADRFPRISLTARYASESAEASDLFDDWLSTLSANLVGPLIDGGSRRAEVARTRAVLSEAIHNYGQTMLTAFADVEDALTRELRQRELLVSLDRQLQLSGQATQRLRDRYLNGNEDFLRLLTAELNHQALERTRLLAARQLIEYRISLYRAMAGTMPLDRPEPAALNAHTPPNPETSL